MIKKWNDYDLPIDVEINGNTYKINYGYKNILEVMKPLNDIELMDEEKIICAMKRFYPEYAQIKNEDFIECAESMMLFISGNKKDSSEKVEKPLICWEKDLSIIIAPINKIVGHDIRMENIHWWTFLSYFMEIGECTFSTYVSIRNKKNSGKKLEKYEEEIFKKNRADIEIKTKYEPDVQNVLDEIKALIGKR